ncbi:MAG: sporulation membrane protein YtrI [Bacillus sp. (in: firmicutes)]
MKIPAISSDKKWQRFFAGVVIGGVVSWLLYFYMHGIMQEKQIQRIKSQEQQIIDLTKKIEIWEKESESHNEETEKNVKVIDIQVTIDNYRDYKLDLLSVIEAQESIRNDLRSLITKDLETVYNSKSLLKKTIENKSIELNEKKYAFEVSEIMFYSTLYIVVEIKRA